MTILNRTETVARRHESSPIGHLPAIILVVLAIIVGATWFFISQGQNELVVAPEIQKPSLEQPVFKQAPAVEKPISDAAVVMEQVEKAPATEKLISDAVIVEETSAVEKAIPTAVVMVEQVEVDPFTTSFPMLDVDWIKVEDLDSIPPFQPGTPQYAYKANTGEETAEWASQFFPELNDLLFAAIHPVNLDIHEDNDVIVAFMDIVVSSDIMNELLWRAGHRTWLILSEDNGKSWTQFASYPVPPDSVEDEPISRLRVKETIDSIIIYVHPAGFEPWMMTTIKKPLN
ncbi:MAG: hypothetical protein KJI69_03180 [Patescibacteria group bacterium]|nr:hypothetical protein [Patescibacteria group bacterium]